MSAVRIIAAAALVFAGAAACQDAVNLDVAYVEPTDAGRPPPASDGGSGGPSDGGAVLTPSSSGEELDGCPCDQTQGLACCVSAAGPAFCTTSKDRCDGEKGGFYRCYRPDPSTESRCCWHGSGAGAQTAYAADCDGGLDACLISSDCAGGQPCLVTECAHVTIGACGRVPTCPPGTLP